MTKREKLKHCIGCVDNFYNGYNGLGIEECWHLPTAKLVKKIRIGVWQRPPYDLKSAIKVFDCRSEKGCCLVKPEALTSDGYWRW